MNTLSKTKLAKIDLDLLIFVERYATNFLRWELLTFFGANPKTQIFARDLASKIGQSYNRTRLEMGDLAILGVLEQQIFAEQPGYRLTTNPTLRTLTIKFAQKNQTSTQHI